MKRVAELDYLEKLLEAQKIIRHDCMNHFQVVHGYLQIGRPETAREYLMKATKSFQRYSVLGKICLPQLQAYLTWALASLGEQGDFLTIQVEDSLEAWKEDDGEVAEVISALFEPLLKDLPQQQVQCQMLIGGKEYTHIHLLVHGQEYLVKEYAGRIKAWSEARHFRNFTVRSELTDVLRIQVGKETNNYGNNRQ
ncbi:hypothetical protein BR63_01240 [Thermanaerosceptrum fracticalcis]|uniref:SpoOB alpha-helical domain-containing protein n=1 Tax=Thermanaerosceptrum fracticalcis TaxID=1712410 RepID=A0A7G6DZ12_THEFR|nr:hypothetical protein BR63_01240 [Thermanaerosceptrum fracticalcis]